MISGSVNEMRFHRETFAVDRVLTRMMEVELFQCVAAVAQAERVTFGAVKLNGMAIVHDLVWLFGPTNSEQWLLRVDDVGDVDG